MKNSQIFMKDNKRLYPLDSLRGLAAIGVAFFWHYQHYVGAGYSDLYPFSFFGSWFFKYGWNLVDFFFVLSGFVFSYTYGDLIISNKIKLKEFVILRLSRLYPLHIILLLYVLLVQEIRIINNLEYFIYQFNDIDHFILNVLLLQGITFFKGWSFNAPSWSISCEIMAYLLFFFILSSLKNKIKSYISFIMLFFIGFIYYSNNSSIINQLMSRVLIGFFTGCLIYKINQLMSKKNMLKIIYTTITFTILFIFFVISYKFDQVLLFGEFWPLIYTIIVYPCMILTSLNLAFLKQILSLRPLTFLGDISYSLYMLSFPIQLTLITLFQYYNININYYSTQFFLFNICITMLFSFLSHILYEKPLQDILRFKFLNR